MTNIILFLSDVRGVLVLARPTGIIIRSGGALFASPPSEATSKEELNSSSGNSKSLGTGASEVARKYARLARNLVESVGDEVRSVEDGVSYAVLGSQLKYAV